MAIKLVCIYILFLRDYKNIGGEHKINNYSSLTSVTQKEEEHMVANKKTPPAPQKKRSRQKNKLDNSENSQGSSFQNTVSVKIRKKKSNECSTGKSKGKEHREKQES